MVAAEYHAKPYEILISDDDESCRESVREALEPHGYQTHVVSCGREAIEVVRRHFVHVMIVDMNMPDLNGLQTVAIIHHEIHVAVPSILMSADNSSELIAQAEEAQVESFVPKPIDLGMLRRAVEQILRRYYTEQ